MRTGVPRQATHGKASRDPVHDSERTARVFTWATMCLARGPGRHEINRIADRRPAFYGPLEESRNIVG